MSPCITGCSVHYRSGSQIFFVSCHLFGKSTSVEYRCTGTCLSRLDKSLPPARGTSLPHVRTHVYTHVCTHVYTHVRTHLHVHRLQCALRDMDSQPFRITPSIRRNNSKAHEIRCMVQVAAGWLSCATLVVAPHQDYNILVSATVQDYNMLVSATVQDYTILVSATVQDYNILASAAVQDYNILVSATVQDCEHTSCLTKPVALFSFLVISLQACVQYP